MYDHTVVTTLKAIMCSVTAEDAVTEAGVEEASWVTVCHASHSGSLTTTASPGIDKSVEQESTYWLAHTILILC